MPLEPFPENPKILVASFLGLVLGRVAHILVDTFLLNVVPRPRLNTFQVTFGLQLLVFGKIF